MAYALISKKSANKKSIRSISKRLNRYEYLKRRIQMPKSYATEVDAYNFIKQDLKEKKWDVRNPTRSLEGEVYTQHEVNGNEELKKHLGGGYQKMWLNLMRLIIG